MGVATLKVDEPVALEPLLAELRSRRDEFQKLRHIPQDVIDKFKALGVYRGLVPEQFGGAGWSARRFMELIEEISAADGSAGWVASFGFATKYISSLPPGTLSEIYANGPDIVVAGAVFPPQPVEQVDGGYRVNGRWGFGSGSMCADIIGAGIRVEGEKGGLPRMAWMPPEQVTIDQTWNTMGMLGTGSHDLVVKNVVVPEHYTAIRGAPSTVDCPSYRYPSMAMAAQVLAVVGLGVAREAIDEVVAIASKKNSITGAPSMADRPGFQIALAQMEAQLRSARAWFYEETDRVWDKAVAKEEISVRDQGLLRLASTQAAKTGADVARRAFELAGTTGIFTGHPLQRYLNDALVVAQHAFMNDGTWQSGGQALLGMQTPPGYP
ncbi:MAG: acyl-CoA dehydrogenase family protein [Proteobacteria bacterium]|nr:acyl-CoA dehydrogenase family protein [Pseudomonadota bacterium]MDA1033440.1 acyl-CoA dehydrogenase family protein [Pseudomonadota bacterium]